MYQLIAGKCRRQEKCPFSHNILPHMKEETWIDAKVNQLSNDKGRCVREMVQKGTCPKKNECNHPHLNDQPSSSQKVCFREVEKQGSCPRGDKCRFTHIISDTDRENPELKRQANLQKISSQRICVNEYRQEHSCHKRDKCGYRHAITEDERNSTSLQEKMSQKWQRITSKPDAEGKSTDQNKKQELPKSFIDEFMAFIREWRALANRPGDRP